MTESIQQKLLRVRPPRVRITYDVETGGAIEKRELPFIVGILADLSGDVPDDNPLPNIKDRKIKDIDRDNFDDVMKSIAPRVDLTPIMSLPAVADLKKSGNSQDTQIVFNSLDDFDPLTVVLNLPTLAEKYRARTQIRGLQSKAECSDLIEASLDSWVGATPVDNLAGLQTELGNALAGQAPANKPAVRAALANLQTNLLTQQAAQTDANNNATDTTKQTAAATATTAAVTALGAWGILSAPAATAPNTSQAAALGTAQISALSTAQVAGASTADPASLGTDQVPALGTDQVPSLSTGQIGSGTGQPVSPATGQISSLTTAQIGSPGAGTGPSPAAIQAGIAYGMLLANAMQADDTPENRASASALLTALKDTTQPSATSTADDKLRYQLRDTNAPLLGGTAVVATLTANIAALDPKAPVGDANWAKALLLLGLTQADDTGAIKETDYADLKSYQDAVNQADCQGTFLNFAGYLNNAANTQRALVVANVFPLLAALCGNNSGSAAAEALLRLHYFAEQVLANLQAKNPDLLAVLKKGAAAIIDEQVVLIDQYLSNALSAIMHSASFQEVEAAWRGLAYLVMNTETSTMLKLRVLNVGMDDLRKDMEKAVEFDQSALFKMIYEAEYDTLGGNPYSLLVGGYEIGSTAEDIIFLQKISEVAASAHAPFIAAASSDLFSLPGFNALDKPRDLSKIFESPELEGWREFRAMEDARYVSLVLPRALLRLPYGTPDKRNTIPCDGLNFDEQVGVPDSAPVYAPNGDVVSYPTPSTDNFLFGNAAYLLAERITNAFSLYNWTAAIRGVEGGGLVENLPIYTYTSDSGMTELLCPTEVSITDRREKELNDLGFISLCHSKGTGQAAFFGGQTTNLPKKYFSDSANANARISSMLPYMLAASRFAHYIKVIMRDKIGSFLTRGNIENFLNAWIANYVLLDDNAPQETKAAYPLRAASVVVTEVPGQPGVFRATAFIKPHFQLEELTTSIRLVADLPA